MTAGPGHNGGPSMEPGQSWRRHCWTAARRALLPNALPVEVVRIRMRRAAEIGLDYRPYATLRASTGHDVTAVRFSSNALRVFCEAQLEAERAAKLQALSGCERVGLAVAPLDAGALAAAAPVLDRSHGAPRPWSAWRAQAEALRAACGRVPGDRVLLVGDAPYEAEWTASGRLAGFVAAGRYFAGTSAAV